MTREGVLNQEPLTSLFSGSSYHILQGCSYVALQPYALAFAFIFIYSLGFPSPYIKFLQACIERCLYRISPKWSQILTISDTSLFNCISILAPSSFQMTFPRKLVNHCYTLETSFLLSNIYIDCLQGIPSFSPHYTDSISWSFVCSSVSRSKTLISRAAVVYTALYSYQRTNLLCKI